VRADEDALTRAIVALASEYGRYGYRRITALLQIAGWRVGKDRVQRIWRREGLKVPQKHRPRGRLWLNDGSCIRLRPERPNHVWSFDFVEGQTHDGRSLRILTLIDEYTRECLALRVERRINSFGVIETLADAMLQKGVPVKRHPDLRDMATAGFTRGTRSGRARCANRASLRALGPAVRWAC
jgi:transposase InsO family protein